jgi:four helix bundle protein
MTTPPPFLDRSPTFQSRCGRFGGAVLRLMKEFPAGHTKIIVADQLSRSATSVGANASEARSAESRADFIHKMQVALKEAREAFHWLTVVLDSGEADLGTVSALLAECDELIAIMVVSVNTAKRNRKATQRSQIP